jgi:hypothetical protein
LCCIFAGNEKWDGVFAVILRGGLVFDLKMGVLEQVREDKRG